MTNNDDNVSMVSSARVVAGGHQCFYSAKSGQSFPALYVCFVENETTNGSSLSSSSPSLFYGQWRNKLDFLRLARASSFGSSTQFPKSAHTKLCDRATSQPWIADLDSITTMERHHHDAVTSLLRDKVNNNICGDMPNSFSRDMTKSLWQLNQFLQSIQTHLHHASSSSSSSSSNKDDELQSAWQLFGRRQDAHPLLPFSDPRAKNNNSISHVPHESFGLIDSKVQTAASLGQYFCSPENATLLVQTALLSVEQDKEQTQTLVWVEPSCGDGRILQHLLHETSHTTTATNHSSHHDRMLLLGYDIDPIAVSACRDRFNEPSTSCSNTTTGMQHRMDCQVHCRDFLTLTRSQLVKDTRQLMAKNTPHLDTTATTTVVDSSNDFEDGIRVVCVGGPPYTTGAGTGSDMKRDLPEQFIRHSVETLHADHIFFFLPQRYERDSPSLLKTLSEEWTYDTQPLPNSTFSFQGRDITQPSILQHWYKNKKTSSRNNSCDT